MRHHVKTIFTALVAASSAFALHAANNETSSQNPSTGQAESASQIQQSSSTAQSGSQSSGQKLLLDQLPKSVRKTMLQHSGGANPENIRETTQNGKQCYTASFDRNGAKGKMTVAQDGSLQSLQESEQFAMDVELPKLQKSQVQFSQLPQPVQQTIKLEAGKAKLGDLSQSQVNGQTLYRADFNREGIRHELLITPEGKIAAQVQETAFAIEPMQNVHALTLKDTPQAVQQAAHHHAHGGQVTDVDKANWNGQTVYSVMIDKNGRLSQWIFDQDGKLVAQTGQQVNEAAGADNSSSQKQEKLQQQNGDQNGSIQNQQKDQSQSQNSNQSPK